MFVDICKYKRGNRTYRRAVLRHSYREYGKIKHKNLGNLSSCTDLEIEVIRWALKNKNNQALLEKINNSKSVQGKSAGATIALYQVMQELGIARIIGDSEYGTMVMWMIMARLIDQGSRLSAVRLAMYHYGCELLGIEKLNEDKLYNALDWFYEQKEKTETKVFSAWNRNKKERGCCEMFLYDVTSSYFEGEQNELAAFGYNKDKKKGKKQLVYGLLTDAHGEPLAVEAFEGNTQDVKTVEAQIIKIKERFNCRYVTFVGDKGMIKTAQMEQLHEAGLYYITGITKPQIESLIGKGLLQLNMFEEELCEVKDSESNVRYILRRNPFRAEEIAQNRSSKLSAIDQKVKHANKYLSDHRLAKIAVQKKNLDAYIKKLKMEKVVSVIADDKSKEIRTQIDKNKLKEMSRLDGCYAIKTDLPPKVANKSTVHDRYKSLSEVEWAFRTEKSILDVRPIHLTDVP